MGNNKTILLTFDYEVFLNKSGTPEKCVLEPVDRLIKIFDETGIKATFYVDVLYYKRLSENPLTYDQTRKIKEQMQRLVKKKHRIELHLHPNWIDAVYENANWVFPNQKHYRLDSFDKKNISLFFENGTEILNSIAKEIDPEYKVAAFRAGGLCVKPFSIIKDAFLKNGIKTDSSVAYGCYEEDEIHKFDFRDSSGNEYLKFSDEVDLEDKNGIFL